jgi:hypothetical protein
VLDHREDHNHFAPAAAVGEASAEQSSESRTEQQRRCDHAFGQRRQAQVFLHIGQGAVDHAGVITEEQAA